MKKKIIKIMMTGCILSVFNLFGANSLVKAESSDDKLGFTYENVMPKNQIGDHSYFELKVTPGAKQQTLITKITNLTDQEKKIKVTVSNATTSSTGIINYGPSKEKLIGKNALLLTDMIDAPNQVKLKPYETKSIKLKLNVPKKEFDGIVLGGIQLKEIKNENTEVAQEGASVQNEYSYLYSISLTETEKKIETEIVSSGAIFDDLAYVNLDNPNPKIVSNLTIEAVLMSEDSDKVLYESRVTGYRMAPNSKLALPIEGTDDLTKGNYRIKTKVSQGEMNWEFESKFEVTESNKRNEQDSVEGEGQKGKTFNWLVIITLIISFLAISGAIFMVLTSKQKNLKTKQKRKK